MVASLWVFAGYTFPFFGQPTRGEAGAWNKKRKVVIQEPLNSNIDVLIDFGFASGRRTIAGHCGADFQTQMMSFFTSHTIGTLTDAAGVSQSCQILEADFKTILPGKLYDYVLTFIAR